MSDEFLEGPNGPVRVPPQLREPLLADAMAAVFADDQIELTFIRNREARDDGTVGDVVGRVRLPRESFVNMVDWMRHSVESREMRVYTLANPKTGAEADKPAMWVDGNVHGNEVQGGEAVLYLAWYLLENHGSNPRATELVDKSVFYFLPSQNPDGRAHVQQDLAGIHRGKEIAAEKRHEREREEHEAEKAGNEPAPVRQREFQQAVIAGAYFFEACFEAALKTSERTRAFLVVLAVRMRLEQILGHGGHERTRQKE